MARVTGSGGGLVKQDGFSIHLLFQGMAGRAGNVLMGTLQGKGRFFVIEERRLPLVAVMARSAVVAASAELPPMRILVAITARCGGSAKFDVHQVQLHVGWLVAIRAGHSAVRALKREASLRVIEARQVSPLLGGVAGLASQRLAGCAGYCHSPGKLSLVHVFMATRTA